MTNRTMLFSRHQPGGLFIVDDLEQHPGNVWFVDSGATGCSDTTGYGRSPDTPFATLDYAIGRCTASNGDVIYLMPGHAESLTSATSLTMDVIGVKVIGLGWGATRPTFTITTANTATWNVTAASCWIENVLIVSNFLNIAAAMTVSATADGLTLKDVEMNDTSVVLAALIQVSIAALCTNVTIDGFRHSVINVAGLTAPATNVILCVGAADHFVLRHSYIHAWTSAGTVALTAGASIGVMIHDNFLVNEDTAAGQVLTVHAGTSGGVFRNFVAGTKNNTETVVGGNICHFSENFGTDTVATSGILTPSTKTAWS